MARILLGWELGGNAGHAARLRAVAAPLLDAGHHLHLVVQSPEALAELASHARVTVWQAPVWSGLMRYSGTRPLGEPGRFGDVLANLGLQRASAFEALLRAWDALLAAIAPTVVVADFAPGLMLAARGRMPRIAIGTGFTVPPAEGDRFPDLPGASGPIVAEEAVLALVNRALDRLGWRRLELLPRIHDAEAALPAVFPELDPYLQSRRTGPLSPFVPPSVVATETQGPTGQGVFAYFSGANIPREAVTLLGQLAPHVPVTAHIPRTAPNVLAELAGAGVKVADRMQDWSAIRAENAAVLGSGGMGFVSSALMLGLPMAVWPEGIEQRLTARALAAHGLGLDLGQSRLKPVDVLADLLSEKAKNHAQNRAWHYRNTYHDPVPEILNRILGYI